MRQIKMYDGDLIAEFDDSQETKDKVFEMVIKYCEEHNSSTGESMQNDDFCIDAAPFIADIIDDVLQFKTHWI